MDITVCKTILPFREICSRAEKAQKSVILLRHSYRQSFGTGTMEPELTGKGVEYARYCGRLLAGMPDVSFGASPRLRCIQTARALMAGGNYPDSEIRQHPELRDTVIFRSPENLDQSIADNSIGKVVQDYFNLGHAEGTLHLQDAHTSLLTFLTRHASGSRNTILVTHDIVAATLMMPLDIYPFHPDDWCGYVQGAVLFCSSDGGWSISYTVPEIENREPVRFFV